MFKFRKNQFTQDQLSDFKGTIIDVREQNEWDAGHIPNAIHISLKRIIANDIGNLDPNKEYLLYCQTQGRSSMALNMLKAKGFNNIHYLVGGYSVYKMR